MLKEQVMALCKERGISINKLEHECALGHATIRKWDKSTPNVMTAKKVADYFGISLCELIGDNDG